MFKAGDKPLPDYTLVKRLGGGGFGEVWQARGPGRTEVALKFVNLDEDTGLQEFRAALQLKSVRCIFLVEYFGIWLLDEQGQVMEESHFDELEKLARRKPLGEGTAGRLRARRPACMVIAMPLGSRNLHHELEQYPAGIPHAQLLSYMETVAEGLDYLHRPIHDLGRGPEAIHHLDVKPRNLVLRGGKAIVCDFGIARALGDTFVNSLIAGTPPYMAPEVLAGKGSDKQSDQYSLAITYYQLRMNRLPFATDNYGSIRDAHLSGTLDFSGVSETELGVLKRATALDPQQRFPTCVEMVQELRAVSDLSQEPELQLPSQPASLTMHVTPVSKSEYSISLKHSQTNAPLGTERVELDAQRRHVLLSGLRRAWEHPSESQRICRQLGNYLYMQFADTAKQAFHDNQSPLVIETSDCVIPWEFLFDGQEFLALNVPLIRMPEDFQFGNSQTDASISRALLIADPEGDNPQAATDARDVQQWCAQNDVKCEALIGPHECQTLNVTTALATHRWDILHYAGAMVHDSQGVPSIQVAGDALKIWEMSRFVSGVRVVFLNICADTRAGTAIEFPSQAAYEFSQSLVNQCAAQAVIVTLWWQGRDTLTGFSAKLYGQLMEGHPLGEAVRDARRAVAELSTHPLMWGSPVVFGNPWLVLHDPHLTQACKSPGKKSVTRDNTIDELLETLGEDASEPEVRGRPETALLLLGALACARRSNWEFANSAHLWMGLTYVEPTLRDALRFFGLDPDTARRRMRDSLTLPSPEIDLDDEQIAFSDNVVNVLQQATADGVIDTALLTRLLLRSPGHSLGGELEELGLSAEMLLGHLESGPSGEAPTSN